MLKTILSIVLASIATLAFAENPVKPNTGLNVVYANNDTHVIQFNNAMTFKNPADRAALATELGIAGGVTGVASIEGQTGALTLADLSLVTGEDIQAWSATLDAIAAGTRTINGHALTGNVTVSGSDVGLGNVSNNAFSGTLTVGNGSVTIGAAGQISAITNPTNLQTTSGAFALSGFSSVTGILPQANGGNGTASPGLVAGSQVKVSGVWPNQTIASTRTTPANQPVWLHSSFNGEIAGVLASYDAVNWVSLGRFKEPTAGDSVRDPRIIFHRGRFYLFYTVSPFNTERPGDFALRTYFGIAVSDDLINWSFLAHLDLTPWLTAGTTGTHTQEIWGPIPAHDANGDLYLMIECNSEPNGGRFFMRPTDQNDVTTLAKISDVTFTGGNGPGAHVSCWYYNGTYYYEGSEGGNVHTVYTASAPEGPYAFLAHPSISAHTEGAGLTIDEKTGDWYAFTDMGTDTAFGVPQYQKSVGGYSSFGDPVIGNVRLFQNSPTTFSENCQCIHYYGDEAIHVDRAIQRVINTAIRCPIQPFVMSQTSSGDGIVNVDGGNGLWQGYSNSTAGSKTTNTVACTVQPDIGYGHDIGFWGVVDNSPVEFEMMAWIQPSDVSVIRVLFGVQKNHLGTLDSKGAGIEWQYNTMTSQCDLHFLVHDGTSVSTALTVANVDMGKVALKVRFWAGNMWVWINGKLVGHVGHLPSATHDEEATAYRCTVVQADCLSNGGAALVAIFGGHWRLHCD